MTQTTAEITGHAVVGSLTEVATWEAELIMCTRLWLGGGPEGQAEVWNSFVRCFGAAQAHAEMQQFERLLIDLAACARRPFVRHGLGCLCIGSDEATLRTLVCEAAKGDLAEAAMIASLMVRAGQAKRIAAQAAGVGRAMQRIARSARRPLRPQPVEARPSRLH